MTGSKSTFIVAAFILVAAVFLVHVAPAGRTDESKVKGIVTDEGASNSTNHGTSANNDKAITTGASSAIGEVSLNQTWQPLQCDSLCVTCTGSGVFFIERRLSSVNKLNVASDAMFAASIALAPLHALAVSSALFLAGPALVSAITKEVEKLPNDCMDVTWFTKNDEGEVMERVDTDWSALSKDMDKVYKLEKAKHMEHMKDSVGIDWAAFLQRMGPADRAGEIPEAVKKYVQETYPGGCKDEAFTVWNSEGTVSKSKDRCLTLRAAEWPAAGATPAAMPMSAVPTGQTVGAS